MTPVPIPFTRAAAEQAAPPPPWLEFDYVALPVLPEVAQRVIEVAGDPGVSVATLSAVVSKDQVLASRILALANSAEHGAAGSVSTVRTAIVRLGSPVVRGVVVAECFSSRLYDPDTYGPAGPAAAHHGIGTAYLARFVGERVGIDLEEAFLCGLLHDIGKLVILKLARDEERRSGQPLPAAEVDRIVHQHHSRVGGDLLKRWNLPESLHEPVTYHHDYPAAPRRTREAAAMHVANRLSHRYGFGCEARPDDVLADPAARLLGIDADWLATVDARAPGLVEVARQIFA